MNIREFIHQAEAQGWVHHIDGSLEPDEKMAAMIHGAGERPVYFRAYRNGYQVVAGICGARRHFALALGVSQGDLLRHLLSAIRHPIAPDVVTQAPCQEVVETEVDLHSLPILTHTPKDGGPYVTAGIAITHHPELGRNVAFHRLMQLDHRRFAIRLVEGRGTHMAWQRSQADLPVAVCIGAPLSAQLAGAISPPGGGDELCLANALTPTPLVRCLDYDVCVPAESEIVLEGRITHELVDEGPFLDLTGTFDIVRPQPIVEVDRITRRRQPIYQALLPGGAEHKLLMGMPREPTIFSAVSDECACLDVNITPGGASWLHAVIQVDKRAADDGRRAAIAAFKGHGSLKHAIVVDRDIQIRDLADVEWAIATRFQADCDLIILQEQPSSSLDPSACHRPGQKSTGAKMALDATIPWDSPIGPSNPSAFSRYGYFEDMER